MRYLPLLVVAACSVHGSIEMTRDVDGAWVHTFPHVSIEDAYHASMRAFTSQNWNIARADPIGCSFTAKSPVGEGVIDVWYRLALVIVEPGVSGGARVRLGLTKTREYKGGGREPNNDRTISDPEDYEELFLMIRKEIEG